MIFPEGKFTVIVPEVGNGLTVADKNTVSVYNFTSGTVTLRRLLSEGIIRVSAGLDKAIPKSGK